MKKIISSLFLLSLSLVVVVIGIACDPDHSHNPPVFPDCAANAPVFQQFPTAFSNLTGSQILPLGKTNSTSHVFPADHAYVLTPYPPATQVPIVMPMAATVTSIRGYTYTNGTADYSVVMQPCEQFQFYFNHLTSLDPGLLAAYNAASGTCQSTSGPNANTGCAKYFTYPMASGATLGAGGFDFGAYDSRITPLTFANPARVIANQDGPGFDDFHVVCPYDYFPGSLTDSTSLKYAIEVTYLQGRIASDPHRCGNYPQEQAGTLLGRWFPVGTDGSETNAIAFIYYYYDPSVAVLSLGLSAFASGGAAGTPYYFSPNSTGTHNPHFENVSADGNVYCFDSFVTPAISGDLGSPVSSVHFLVKMISATQLQIEMDSGATCGAGPWTMGSSTTYTYNR